MSANRRRLLAGAVAGTAAALVAPVAADTAPNRDVELIRLCTRFSVLERLKNSHFCKGSNPIIDDDERDLAFEPIDEEQEELLDRIVAMKATTKSRTEKDS